MNKFRKIALSLCLLLSVLAGMPAIAADGKIGCMASESLMVIAPDGSFTQIPTRFVDTIPAPDEIEVYQSERFFETGVMLRIAFSGDHAKAFDRTDFSDFLTGKQQFRNADSQIHSNEKGFCVNYLHARKNPAVAGGVIKALYEMCCKEF